MIIPITSSLSALRFSFTVKIEPSNLNGLTLSSVVMVFQIRAIDRKRIIKKIGDLKSKYLNRLMQKFGEC